MPDQKSKFVRFGVAIAVVVLSLAYLAYTGVQQSKSYYVTIKELRTMEGRYEKRLRVAGNVVPGSIKRQGTRVEFLLKEKDPAGPEEFTLPVVYVGTEAPPDTFKDESQALAEGQFGRDGVFHAKQLQAKCASKYAPQQQNGAPSGAPSEAPRPTQKAQADAATFAK
jgi:cytochrome c-type biogenesis protein CcmE